MRAGLLLGFALAFTPMHASGQAAVLLNGVASGDVSQSNATLWARANTPGTLSFDVSTASDFGSTLFSFSQIIADAGTPTHQYVSGLAAGTRYFYRATDAGGDSSFGTFVTPDAPGASGGLRFGVSGDARGDFAPFPAIANVPARNLDFFLHLGDSIYADAPSPLVPLSQASSLAEFQAKHAEQLLARSGLNTWVDLRQSTALFATIDDHEVTNDFAGAALIGSNPRFAGTGAPSDLISNSSLYRNGLQAFQDYMPIEERTYAGTGDPRFEGRPDLYRVQRFGDDAALIVLDTRSFRDPQIDASTPAAALANSFAPDRTMLGRTQLDRFKADLLAAQAAGAVWKFVAISVPIQNLGPFDSADRYEGYAAERAEILGFIKSQNIRNVVFVAADVHGSAINNLTYQLVNASAPGTSFLGPQIPVDSFEVATGSVVHPDPLGARIARIAAGAGLITGAQLALYNSLPIAPDRNSTINDKDDFVQAVINGQLATFPTNGNPYSPLGLGDFAQASQLLTGDWLIGHSYGWTEFEIDALSRDLLITTWGIPYTDVLGALNGADPSTSLAGLSPRALGTVRVAASVAAVPEPATWAMMLVGFGAVGWQVRRRRSTVQSAGRSTPIQLG